MFFGKMTLFDFFAPVSLALLLIPLLAPISWVHVNGFGDAYLDILKDSTPTVKGDLGTLAGAVGIEATYDYVVIGGGTAGNTIGSRLAEAGFRVAIIEAGAYYEIEQPVLSTAPAGYIFPVGADPEDTNPLIDWDMVTSPQAGANNRQVHYARGKCLGGSSALNAMIYQRGTEGSYAQWAESVQDDSYQWNNLLPYLERSFNFTPPDTSKRLQNATTDYNSGVFNDKDQGPIEVSYTNFVTPFATWMKASMEAVGIKVTRDFSSGHLLGTQYSPSTISPNDESRSSSESFIRLHQGMKTLQVYTETLARKIFFNANKEATGVEVDSGGKTYKIHASKEVIASAGAFQSPQVLMVSGIGPAEILDKFNIPVLSDLPGVGQNMWDHVYFGPSYRVNLETATRLLHDPAYLAVLTAEYTTERTGPLANAPEVLGWEKVPDSLRSNFTNNTLRDLSNFATDWPELEYIPGNAFVGNFSNLALNQPWDGYQYATILGTMVAPTSRGNVTIASSSTSDLPIVNPNWLTTETDVEVAVALYKRMREMWNKGPLHAMTIGSEYYPGEHVHTDQDILNVIKESLMTVWHASCTCKMGTRNDPMAVVDSQAKVFGVDRLRVVDASSFPLLPPGHPQSAVYMLAEKIANVLINEKYGEQGNQ